MKLEQTNDESSNTLLSRVFHPITVVHQTIIDKLYPYKFTRWLIAFFLFMAYVLRIASIQILPLLNCWMRVRRSHEQRVKSSDPSYQGYWSQILVRCTFIKFAPRSVQSQVLASE
ncbi:unnamed protein product [Heterobilharzia americana]|nr:unnamed protein product [Heterobilharzia americana]